MRNVTIALLAAAGLLWGACSKDQTSPPVTADALINQGWQAYAAHNYQGALDKFTAALGMDPNNVDAHNGVGWASAKKDDLAGSLTAFMLGRTRDSTNLQINAGLSVVYNAQKDYPSSIERGSYVLQSNPQWSFSRDTSVNSFDLNVIIAEDYFALADFASSLAAVKILNPSFNADVTQLSGQSALAKEIERLSSLY